VQWHHSPVAVVQILPHQHPIVVCHIDCDQHRYVARAICDLDEPPAYSMAILDMGTIFAHDLGYYDLRWNVRPLLHSIVPFHAPCAHDLGI